MYFRPPTANIQPAALHVAGNQPARGPAMQEQTQPAGPPATAFRNPGALRGHFPGYQPRTASPAQSPQQTYSGASYGGYGNPQAGQQATSAPTSAPTSGQATANITSAYGTPVLPFGDPNLNQQTINRQFEQALGNRSFRSMLNGMRPAGNGMLSTQGDQSMLLPAMTQQATAGANALANTPYQMGLANANSLLNWQTGQANDVLGQFQNQLEANNALQGYGLNNILAGMNFNTGQLGQRLGFGQDVLNSLYGPGSINSNLLGGMSGMSGNLLGGLMGGIGNPLAGILGG